MPLDPSIPLGVRPPEINSPQQTLATIGQQRAQQQAQQESSQLRQLQIGQHQQASAQAQREAAMEQQLRGLFSGPTPPTPDAIMATVGPERGTKIVQGLAALKAENQKAYSSQQALIKDVLAGMDALPEGVRAETYPAVRKNLLDRQLITEQDAPPEYDPAWFQQVRSFGQAQAKPAEPYTLAPGAQRFGADNKVVASVPVTPPKPAAPPSLGGEADYLTRYAAERHLQPEQLTTKDIEQAMRARAAAGRAPEDNSALDLTPAGLDLTAKQFAMTGLLPPMGNGGKGATVRTKIINRAAAMYDGLDLASQRTAFVANQESLKKLQVQRDAMGAFESTAVKNLQVFLTAAGKVVDSGSPMLNKPLRSIAESVLGSPDMTAYQTARRTVIPEFAKLLANPGLSGQLSDSARKEVEDVVRGDATLKQIVSAAKVLTTDVTNRTTSYDDQIKAIQKRIATPPGGSPPAEAAAAPKMRKEIPGHPGKFAVSADGGKTWQAE